MRWLREAERLIPICSQVFSKAPNYFVRGEYPVYIERGKGSHVWDVDGNEFIDYILALGPITIGYGVEEIDQAIREQLKEGIIFALPHPLEVKVSKKLTEIIPCAEMVRFSKTGSDVNSAAVRLARAYTGREKIIYGSYHGWHDWYSVTTPRDKGIPRRLRDLIIPFEYNSLESLERALYSAKDEVAAVIMEPVLLDPPNEGFLSGVVEVAHRYGALVIFDEIVTGFRWHLGGAQAYYGVVPDLATFGKGMANGMPLAAVVGRKDIMCEAEHVFFSTTFGGETLSLSAALATIEFMEQHDVPGYFWRIGSRLQEFVTRQATESGVDVRVKGLSPHFKLTFPYGGDEDNPIVKSLFLQEMVRRGILVHPGGFNLCYSHRDGDIQSTEFAMAQALRVVAEAVQRGAVETKLEGLPYQLVFKRN